MLTVSKNITITGQSIIGNSQALFLSATISTDGSNTGNITTTITDATVYTANKIECRKDIADFQNIVYAAQDEALTEAETKTTTN
jgi:hypothetical protein